MLIKVLVSILLGSLELEIMNFQLSPNGIDMLQIIQNMFFNFSLIFLNHCTYELTKIDKVKATLILVLTHNFSGIHLLCKAWMVCLYYISLPLIQEEKLVYSLVIVLPWYF